MAAERLQDDARFVDSYVTYRAARGFGPVRIRAELQQRGISGAVLESALAPAALDWRVCARVCQRKKFGEQPARDFADRAKRSKYLEYKGFTPTQIRAALNDDEELD